MQVYTKTDRVSLKTIFIFVLILVAAYLPIASFIFYLKNDAFRGYFPPKFFMSESLHAGYLPLWNPYINYGLPQYGDMSSAFWSPVTWLVASTVGYNAYTFTIEELLYLLIGCVGMYKLLAAWGLEKKICFIGAIAYLCCGYNVGHLQHFNWISGAAFLPWCLWSYIGFFEKKSVKNGLLCALIFYLLLSAAHPGISIGCAYFFIALSLFRLLQKNTLSLGKKIKPYLLSHVGLLVMIGILSAGMIIGYADVLPHITRGEKVSMAATLSNPTTLQSWISVLLPLSTVKNDALFVTDISMRNCYFSLGLLLFFFLFLFNKKNALQKFFLIAGIAFLLLSTGGIFKAFAYRFFPLIGYVRLNGEFRIFSLFCFIIIACFELDKFTRTENNFKGKIKNIFYLINAFVFLLILFGFYKSFSAVDGILHGFKNILNTPGLSSKLKALIDSISFYDTLWIQGIIQLLVLSGIKYCLQNRNTGLLVKVFSAELILASLLNVPFTGAGKAPVAAIQQLLNQSPKGIPVPVMQPVANNESLNMEVNNMIGSWSFYNKQPGNTQFADYPIVIKSNEVYIDNIASRSFANRAIFFYGHTTDTINHRISIKDFSPGHVFITANTAEPDTIVYQQNYYPHWFYDNGQEKKQALHFDSTFLAAPVAAGNNNITFSFEPRLVKTGLLLSLLAFCTTIFLLFYQRKK